VSRPKIVAGRLGHANASMRLDVYSHFLHSGGVETERVGSHRKSGARTRQPRVQDVKAVESLEVVHVARVTTAIR
jgi:flavin reductase (DIM6/NTAB) family NADH-FMN oxidoreductase RutF